MKKKILITGLLLAPVLCSAQRDPWHWPFDKHSIWNHPVGDSAVYKDAGFHEEPYVGGDMVYLVKLSENDPLREVHNNAWKNRCSSNGYQGYKLNIPDGFHAYPEDDYYGGTPNSGFAFLKAGSDEFIMQGQVLGRCDDYGNIYYPSWVDRSRTESIFGDGLNSSGAMGHGASSMNSLGGTIRKGELSGPEPIRHALKVNCNNNYLYGDGDGYRWPARAADFDWYDKYTGNLPYMEIGTMLAIPPWVDKDSLGLETTAGAKLFDALRDYGAYIVETGWTMHYFIVEAGVEEENECYKDCSSGPYYRDVNKLFENMHAVTNNGPGNIGGGGDPIAPFAPDFANTPPAADFSVSTDESLQLDVDASSTTDYEDNTLAYTWNFGDGNSGEGLTASHTYDEAGIYQLTLTVTEMDDRSLTSKLTREVLVPNTLEGFPGILNGSFEQGVFSWDTSKINVSVNTDGHGDGHAIQLQDKTTAFSRGLSQTLYGLQADTGYTVSFYAKSPVNQELECIVADFSGRHKEYIVQYKITGSYQKYEIEFSTTTNDNKTRLFFNPIKGDWVRCSSISTDNTRAHWDLEDAGSGFYRIIARDNSSSGINIEGLKGYAQHDNYNGNTSWYSVMWKRSKEGTGDDSKDYYSYECRWFKPGDPTYLSDDGSGKLVYQSANNASSHWYETTVDGYTVFENVATGNLINIKSNPANVMIDSVSITIKGGQGTGVETVGKKSLTQLVVYPNPASDFLNVEFPSGNKTISWNIVDVTGNVVLTGQASGDSQIDISTLANGMYFIYRPDEDTRAVFVKKN